MCDGTGMAVEYQRSAAHHGHGLANFVTPYQHRSLEDVQKLIEADTLTVSSVIKYSEHLYREDHYDHEAHQHALPQLEKGWENNYAGEEHVGLACKPGFIGRDKNALHWSGSSADNDADSKITDAAVLADAVAFKHEFEQDAQYVFSRVQHHWHKLVDGQRMPLNYCALKQKGKKHLCRSDFPLQHKVATKARIVCPCVAKKLHLKAKGRKNMLGTVSGKRRCPWLSGTNGLTAVILRSNTHFVPNFRIPLTAKTTECQGACLGNNQSENPREHLRRLITITQRAMKQMTGYFSGYICKKQKLGNFELKSASAALPFLLQRIRTLKTASAQLAQITNRLISTLEGKGILRSAGESFTLAGKHRHKDELNAEFVRTFQSKNFNGSLYLAKLEFLRRSGSKPQHLRVMLPSLAQSSHFCGNDVDFYGYRGEDPRVHYLSPWEFTTYWYTLGRVHFAIEVSTGRSCVVFVLSYK